MRLFAQRLESADRVIDRCGVRPVIREIGKLDDTRLVVNRARRRETPKRDRYDSDGEKSFPELHAEAANPDTGNVASKFSVRHLRRTRRSTAFIGAVSCLR